MNTVRYFALLLFAFTRIPALAQLQYVPLQTPCRAVDTRQAGGALADDSIQVFDPGKACGIPSQGNNLIVFAMNITVVPHGGLGALTVYGTGVPTPNASTLNSYDGRVKSNYALVTGGVGTGDVSVWASNATDVILDVSGYFVQIEPLNYYLPAMLYTPVAPCRLIDTRNSAGALGGPSLTAGKQRTFSLAGQCNLPDLSGGGALSVNVTAVPKSGLGYLTVWGTSATGNTPPATSTLNSLTGTVVANAAFLTINPGTNTSISAIASNDTDLIVDVTGYFSENTTGMAYYPTAVPERILDTRISETISSTGIPVMTDDGPPFTGQQTYAYSASPAVYVLNATVVPTAPLWVLTLWPDGIAQPLVSTLNSYDASVTSNMAIVTTSADGAFDAFAQAGPTQLILDLSGSFMALVNGGGPPTAVFIGDEMSASLVAEAQTQSGSNAGWQCINCLGTTTSVFALANLPAVIAMKPKAVHILVGAHELQDFSVVPPDSGSIPGGNILSMVTMLKAANIPVAVGTMPACPKIDSYRLDLSLIDVFTDTLGPPEIPGVPLIRYDEMAPLPPANQQSPVCAANNFDPNAAGYYLMVPLAQQGISQALQGAVMVQ
jgi:hypothetical protein